jgi:hypothetical protein
MNPNRLDKWLRWLRATATFVLIAAMCLAVAVLVIAFIPGSPVTQDLPAGALNGLHSVRGVTSGVAVDRSGWIPFTVHDPSIAQRSLAEIARRLANLLRIAQVRDPFTAVTARALWSLGKLTAFGGLGTWVLSQGRAGTALCNDAGRAEDVRASPVTFGVARRGPDLRRPRTHPRPRSGDADRT